MDRRLSTTGTAILIALGLLNGPLRAQERETLPPPSGTETEGEVIFPQSAFPVEAPAPPPPPPAARSFPPFQPGWVPNPKPPKQHLLNGPVCHWVRSLGCWSCINCYGCGSLDQECKFIFGSCRAFYGEPCYKSMPPPLVPVGWVPPPGGIPNGYGPPPPTTPGGYGPSSCGCNH